MKLKDYLEEQLGTAERGRMDYEISEISQMLSEIIKKLSFTRQIGKAYFGKELMKVEKDLRKSQKDVDKVVSDLRSGWK